MFDLCNGWPTRCALIKQIISIAKNMTVCRRLLHCMLVLFDWCSVMLCVISSPQPQYSMVHVSENYKRERMPFWWLGAHWTGKGASKGHLAQQIQRTYAQRTCQQEQTPKQWLIPARWEPLIRRRGVCCHDCCITARVCSSWNWICLYKCECARLSFVSAKSYSLFTLVHHDIITTLQNALLLAIHQCLVTHNKRHVHSKQ